MAVAKNPGAGRGKGGGRPRRESAVEEVRLRLSPHAAEKLRAAAEARNVPAWRMVEDLIAGLEGGAPLPLPPEVQELAREAAAFLEAQEDRPAAVKALRRAWKQALTLARGARQGREADTSPINAGEAPATSEESPMKTAAVALDLEGLESLLPLTREILAKAVSSAEACLGQSIATMEELEPLLPRLTARLLELARDGRRGHSLVLEALESL